MLRFVLTRLALILPTFIGVTLLTFALIRLVPGDPVELMAGERGLSPARHAELRHDLGLDQPLLVQYGRYIGQIAQGDLGQSIVTRSPVLDEFLTLFPATVELSLCAILFALVIGIPAGIIAAVRRNSVFDHGVIPDHYVIENVSMIDIDPATTPGVRLHGNPMYGGRALSIFTMCLGAVMVGATYNALDEYENLSHGDTSQISFCDARNSAIFTPPSPSSLTF